MTTGPRYCDKNTISIQNISENKSRAAMLIGKVA